MTDADTMAPGRVIADRFEIERIAGQGGTATIYRARDRQTGEPVALKIGHPGSPAETERFIVEARVLSELAHPGIVRYVAHGPMPPAQWFLALEWLEGEDVARRIKQRGLTVREAVQVIVRAAEALGHAHQRGIVHRDVKPSNLFLVGGRTDDVRLLDFGVARRDERQAITRTGLMLGTLGYMSAEQVRGERDIDARTDVFALGCVLFKCITGANAFAGDNALSVLAKILLEEPPRLSEIVGVPPWLDELCTRMLAKNRAHRPSDGAAVAAEIRAAHDHDTLDADARPPPSVSNPGITAGEQRLVSVALVRVARASADEFDRLALRIRALGGQLDQVGGGSVLVSMQGGAATDLVMRAARCTLALRRTFRTAPIAMATGRAVVSARTPFGDVIDRASKLLDMPVETSGEYRPVRIDDVTARLLDERFITGSDARGPMLRGEQAPIDASRTLLGKPTPCLGRERELANLLAMYDECIGEPLAQAVLVTAPPGGGKSRVRHELGRRLASHARPPRIWTAHGDPMSAGSSLAMVAQIVRRQLGVQVGENVQSARAKILEGVGERAEFLGELLGVPFPDEDSIALRSARRDAIVMGDLMRRAWEEFVRAELARGPLLLVLDDLHWSDAGSISYIDGVLRLCRDSPLMVLALARPNINEVLGDFWRARGLQRFELRALPRAASEKLVREALGDTVGNDAVARIVAQAGGNPFFLEELVRAESEGSGAAPASVVAMVQGRVEALDGESRRLLRAASVLGEVFWSGAVKSLLGSRSDGETIAERLQSLVERELVVEVSSARFPGEAEYAFRHSVVREVAYDMLTDDDRALAHRLAGAWLEKAKATDAAAIAEHYERGGESSRAASAWAQAAESAIEANDLPLAIARAERGIACGASDAMRTQLRLLQAEASYWIGNARETVRRATEAMASATVGSRAWYRAVAHAIIARARLVEYDALEALAEELYRAPHGDGDGDGERVVAIARAVPYLIFGHRQRLVPELVAELEAARDVPEARGWVAWVDAVRALSAQDNEAAALAVIRAVEAFEHAGDLRSACLTRVNLGVAYNELGLFFEARRVLRTALADAERLGLAAPRADAAHNLGWSLGNLGAFDEALDLERIAMEFYEHVGAVRMQVVTSIYIAIIHARAGDFDRADVQIRSALAQCKDLPSWRAYALATLAHVLHEKGEAAEAVAREAYGIAETIGNIEEGDAYVRLVHAEVLGDAEAARAAQKRVLERASKIKNAEWREAFLAVPEQARTIELAQILGSKA